MIYVLPSLCQVPAECARSFRAVVKRKLQLGADIQ
jgi:hypothetical protein